MLITDNPNFKIICVNGPPESGKSTFEKMCQKILTPKYCQVRSTVDEIKRIATECGWNGEKTPEARKFLSDLKDLLTNFNDMPFRDIVEYATAFETNLIFSESEQNPHILFVDVREPPEIQRFKDELGAESLLIWRPGHESGEILNHADKDVFDFTYDYEICNDGSLEQLESLAANFVSTLITDDKPPWED